MYKKLLVFLAKCKYPIMSALVERTFRLWQMPSPFSRPPCRRGHSPKSSVAAGLPNGSSCTHSRAPASSPCFSQARGWASSSACEPHLARRSGACHIRGTALRDCAYAALSVNAPSERAAKRLGAGTLTWYQSAPVGLEFLNKYRAFGCCASPRSGRASYFKALNLSELFDRRA
jgi:hypothetical protein